MNNLRKILTLLMALMLATFALPSIAQQKIFSLKMTPATSAGSPAALTATFKNETPSGNSSFNSLVLTAPAGLTITAFTPPPSGTATITNGGQKIQVSNMSPVGNGQTFVLNLTVTSAGATSCAATSGAWSAVPWTGSTFSGNTFALVPANSSLTTTVTTICNYSLTTSPASVDLGATPTLTATFTNPAASSKSFNSVTLTAPSGFSIQQVTGLSGGRTASITTLPAQSVTISGIAPAVMPGQQLGVSLKLSVDCNASGGSWGSSVAGGFALSDANPSTGLTTGQCSVVFFPAPPSAIISGVAVAPTVGVKALDGGGGTIASFTGPVTFTLIPQSSTSTGSVLAGTPTNTGGVLTYPNLTITGSGTFKLQATSAVGSVSATTQTSVFTVYQGELFCGDPLQLQFTNPGGGAFGTPGYAEGQRFQNKDNSTCVKVDYTYENNILTQNTVRLTWDTGAQPNAVFVHTAFWRPEFIDPTTGFPKRRTKVAWELDGSGNPIYVFANSCLSQTPPAPYTTVGATGLDGSSTTLQVNTPAGTLPQVPFAVAINSERLTVTAVSGNSWTVVRGAGGTTAAAHVGGASVMSTPLPIDNNASKPGGGPNPYVGKQNRMCIWDETYTSVPAGSYDCSTTSPGYNPNIPVACIQRSSSVFDIGDGFMSLD